jgi:hypothetical protein
MASLKSFKMESELKELSRRLKQSLRDRVEKGSLGFNYGTTSDTISVGTSYSCIPCTWFSTGDDVNSRVKDSVEAKYIEVKTEVYPAGVANLPSGSLVRNVIVRQKVNNTAVADGYLPIPQQVFTANPPGVLTPLNPIYIGPDSNHSFEVLHDELKVLGAVDGNTISHTYANGEPILTFVCKKKISGDITWRGSAATGDTAQAGHIYSYTFADCTQDLTAYHEHMITYLNH